MAMDPPSWVLLNRGVLVGLETLDKDSNCVLECRDVKAYTNRLPGEEYDAEWLLKGMKLCARFTEPPDLSSLSMYLSRSVLGGRGIPFLDSDESESEELCLDTSVETADDEFIVLTTSFPYFSGPYYYIIYNIGNKSLSMIRHLPRDCEPYLTTRPLVVRRCNGDGDGDGDGDYSLAIMAKDADDRNVLCLWPPPASCRTLVTPSLFGIEPWKVKQPVLPLEMPGGFTADLVFSFQGQAFWVDLAQGILCCDCEDVLSGGFHVQFHYIRLPRELCLDNYSPEKPRETLAMYRTMSCAGDSIKFASVSHVLGSLSHVHSSGDNTITLWALDLVTKQWSELNELSISSMWELETFKKAGLPKAIPFHPVLSTQQDGVLYLLLQDDGCYRTEEEGPPPDEADLFTLDMVSKNVLSATHLPFCPYIYDPYIMGFDISGLLQNHCLYPLVDPKVVLAPLRNYIAF